VYSTNRKSFKLAYVHFNYFIIISSLGFVFLVSVHI